MKTYIRFSMMREREIILKHKTDINGLIVDAHIIETFQNATSGFIAENSFNFIVDPITYKFFIDSDNDIRSKRWYERLVDLYNLSDLILDDGNINKSELKNSRLRKFVSDIINYEKKRVSELSSETFSLMSLVSGETIKGHMEPYCLIPPYCIIEGSSDLDLNINIINAVNKSGNDKIYAMIPIFNDLIFDDSLLQQIIDKYSCLDVDGYFIWITDLNEINERGVVLNFVKQFIENLKSKTNEKEILNMYGGFYSTILASQGILDGLAHGVGLSESKDPYSLGGPAPTRYYVPIIHRMLSTESASDLLSILNTLCECDTCSEKDISEMSVGDLMNHALNSKIMERNQIQNLTIPEIKAKLERDFNSLSDPTKPALSIKFRAAGNNLHEWINAL